MGEEIYGRDGVQEKGRGNRSVDGEEEELTQRLDTIALST